MRVMTFNLRVDIPEDGKNSWAHRSQKVAAMINKHRPLVVGTQEGLLRMIEDIESELAGYRWIGQGRRGGMSDEFCAIFYDHNDLEVLESGQFWLSEQPDVPNSISWDSDFPRVCTWGHFRFKKEPYNEFIHYNTHLDHISQQAREHGIHLISKRLDELHRKKNLPVILTGDFNSEPQDPVIRFLRGDVSLLRSTAAKLNDAFSQTDDNPGCTFHNFKGGREGAPIDFIFTTPEVQVLRTEIDRSQVDGAYPSDHYPVISTLNW